MSNITGRLHSFRHVIDLVFCMSENVIRHRTQNATSELRSRTHNLKCPFNTENSKHCTVHFHPFIVTQCYDTMLL